MCTHGEGRGKKPLPQSISRKSMVTTQALFTIHIAGSGYVLCKLLFSQNNIFMILKGKLLHSLSSHPQTAAMRYALLTLHKNTEEMRTFLDFLRFFKSYLTPAIFSHLSSIFWYISIMDCIKPKEITKLNPWVLQTF